MSVDTPVSRVVAILQGAGYRLLDSPITIGNVPFDFAAALLGTGKSPDLVVVIDTVEEKEARTRQKIGVLGRAMDVVGSRRPVTAILAGPRPDEETLDAISRVCRVLPIGTPTGSEGEQLLEDWLSVLLPLKIPPIGNLIADAEHELRVRVPSSVDSELVNQADEKAQSGQDAVRAWLKQNAETILNEAGVEVDAVEGKERDDGNAL